MTVLAGLLAAVNVLLPQDASPSQQTAAEELREYCGKMGIGSGTIELKTDESLGENGYTLETVGERLVISGSKARGVLNGAYGYLQDTCGIDWLSSWCEAVPKRTELPAVAKKETHQPSFEVRDSFWRDIIDHQRFGARIRLNKHSFVKPDPKFGPDLNPFDTVLGECHTYKRILDQDVHFKDHPEWFSEVNGKRKDGQTQLCTTNPEVLRRTIAKVFERIAANPSAKYFGVDPNDYYFNCECAACKAINDREGTAGGATMAFVNRVAEAVAAKHSDKFIKISVYQYNAVPPKTFRIHRNVFLDLSPIDGGYLYPKATSTLEGDVKTREDMAKWKAISDGVKVMNWDYTMNFHQYLLPFANVPSIQPNLRYWKSLGGTYEFVQGDNKGYHGEFAELKGWLVAQLLWNVDADVPALVRRFMRGYYGPAAEHVEAYYDFLNAYERSDRNRNKRVSCADELSNRPELMDDAFLAKASDLWRKAEAAVADSPAHSYNVRMSALPIDYILYCKYAKHVNLTHDPKAFEKGLASAKRLSSRFKEAAAAGREIALAESDAVDRRVLPQLHAYAAGTQRRIGDGNRATIGAKGIFRQGFYGQAHTEAHEDSFDGTVMCLNNDNYGWLTSYNLDQVAFDPNVEYAIRVRFRAKATGRPGEVFQIGVCNNSDDSYPIRFSVDGDGLKAKDGFAWYEIGSWKPRENETLYFAPGWFDLKKSTLCPQHDGIEVDCFEIYRKDLTKPRHEYASCVKYEDEFIDRMWLWGHLSGQVDGTNNLWKLDVAKGDYPMSAALKELGLRNLNVIRWDRPSLEALREFKDVKRLTLPGSAHDAEGVKDYSLLHDHVFAAASVMDNVVGIELDDYYRSAATNEIETPTALGWRPTCPAAFSLRQLTELRKRADRFRRPLDLRLVVYDDLFKEQKNPLDLIPAIEQATTVTYWTWKAENLKDLERSFRFYQTLAPTKPTFLGIYLYDFGGEREMTAEEMKFQLDFALRKFREGEIEGVVFLCSSIVNRDFAAIRLAKAWIRENGKERRDR